MGEKITQCERVLRHLNDYGSITCAEAVYEYGIMRLPARVSDLKRLGFPIETERKKGKNRYGENVSFASYSLVKSGDSV